MMQVIKKLFYLANILTIMYIIFISLFSICSIRTTYKSLVIANSDREKKYNESVDRYKEVINFILKNKLPQNMAYFNAVGNATYNLPAVKEFQVVVPRDILIHNHNSKMVKDVSNTITECNNKCIKIVIDPQEILKKLSKNNLWKYGEIITLYPNKITLLRTSINVFLELHKNLLFITLVYFFALYLCQLLILFRKNKTSASLAASVDKSKKDLNKRSIESDALYENLLFAFDLVGEYFTHHIDQLLARDAYVEEVQLTSIMQQIKIFFGFQLIKKNLKFILEVDDIKTIKTDNEMVFIILLNLISRTVHRSKISSNINVKIYQFQDITNIEICDTGYMYKETLNNKIQMHELPEPILEKFCQKLKIEITETRKDMDNTISIKIVDLETPDPDETDEPIGKTVKIRITPIWQ